METIDKHLIQSFDSFADQINPKLFSRNLRTMLIEFLKTDEARDGQYVVRLLEDMDILFSLLNDMEDARSRP